MEMLPVDSSNLSAVGYDIESATLRIEFLKSGSYEYYGVPLEVHEGLMGAASKGTYFDQFIKKAGYSYTKL